MGLYYTCYGCKKDLRSLSFSHIKVIDYKGDERYENVCSQECFEKVQQSNIKLHKDRYLKLLNQEFNPKYT